jgi:hypothetical protein
MDIIKTHGLADEAALIRDLNIVAVAPEDRMWGDLRCGDQRITCRPAIMARPTAPAQPCAGRPLCRRVLSGQGLPGDRCSSHPRCGKQWQRYRNLATML